MRLLLFLLSVLLLSSYSYSQEVIPENETVNRDGLVYHQDTNELVTGTVEFFYENGQLQYRINYIDGEREGLREWFDKNGRLTKP